MPDTPSAHGQATPPRPDPGLDRFVRQARTVGRRRIALGAAVEWAALTAAIALGGTMLAAATLRGDLAAGFALLGWAVGSSVLVVRTRARTLRAFGRTPSRSRTRARSPSTATSTDPWLATARIIATTGRALYPTQGRSAADDPELDHDAAFRREILAAYELDRARRLGELRGSPALAERYVAGVSTRLFGLDPRRAVPRPQVRGPALVLASVLAIGVVALANPKVWHGAELLVGAKDGRPEPPPQPVWSQLDMTLTYPAHTGRPQRTVHNPSGSIRVPAGTTFDVELRATTDAPAARLVLSYDGASFEATPPPLVIELEAGEDRRFSGSFTVQAGGEWRVVLEPSRGWDGIAAAFEGRRADRRSPPLTVELEPDDPPEVDLRPLPEHRREVSETDAVDIRFTARDDFGLDRAELVYELDDGSQHRVRAGRVPEGRRRWQHRFTWDLSAIPVETRGEVMYWIEVRDNDPGLGLEALPDPPGKVGRSARQALIVNDEEAEHARNIDSLRAIRDAAVDLLAERLTTTAYDPSAHPPAVGVGLARNIFASNEKLLAMLATAIDALAMDAMARERDVASLSAIHGRLRERHEAAREILTRLPPGQELERPELAGPVLAKLKKHNQKALTNLEDEIIRLDDLVDAQIAERLERLLARVEASQRKLVELLEQLKAGDESVRPQIEQLRQRIRDDLRKVSKARSQLQKELGNEFMNLDAFRAMEKRMQRMELEAQLQRGDVDGALESAKQGLDELGQLRDGLQRKLGQDGEQARLSPEERDRMQLLRELSRLLDEQNDVVTRAKRHEQAWRNEVANQPAKAPKQAEKQAAKIEEALEKVNDARLGREGRRGWEDAREALQRLEDLAQRDDARQLELFDAARSAAQALERAAAGAKADEAEGKALEKLRKSANQLAESLRDELPQESSVFDEDRNTSVGKLGEAQGGVEERTRDVSKQDIARVLPDEGAKALRSAQRGMQDTRGQLDPKKLRPDRAADAAKRAADGLQRAIDSLRQNQSPPPPASASGEASTEAERDRTLRDELVEAMKERAPEGFDDQVESYYEELLR